jgi:hypothetical protein
MIINNKKSTLNIWLQKLVATVLFTPLLLFILFSRQFKEPVLGIDREIWLVVSVGLYMGFIGWHHLLRPNYIYFSDNGKKILFRYYKVRALSGKKHAIEIPKEQFEKYEVKKYFPGIEKLFLYQRTSRGVARYPGVSLSLLKKSDREKMKRALNQYVGKLS